jgi:hypothetical protein
MRQRPNGQLHKAADRFAVRSPEAGSETANRHSTPDQIDNAEGQAQIIWDGPSVAVCRRRHLHRRAVRPDRPLCLVSGSVTRGGWRRERVDDLDNRKPA